MKVLKNGEIELTERLMLFFKKGNTKMFFDHGICCAFDGLGVWRKKNGYMDRLEAFAIKKKYLKKNHPAYWFPRTVYGHTRRLKLLKAYLNHLEKK